MLGALRSSNELECKEWKSLGLNEADGWQFRKQRPVHQPGPPFCVSLGLCTICKRKTIEERGGQGMNTTSCICTSTGVCYFDAGEYVYRAMA